MPVERRSKTDSECQAKTKAGRPCAAPAVREGIYCALHSDPERAAQLGRKGGARNRHVYLGDGKEVAPPQTASDVKEMLAEVMAEIRAGKMDPKRGTTLGYLGTSLLRAIETSDIEQRLEKLEHGLKKLEQTVTEPNRAPQHEEGCICFPADESLHFTSEESRAGKELQCPLHGQRIPAGEHPLYRPKWLGNDRDNGWSRHSVQYRRAMAATYDYLEGRL